MYNICSQVMGRLQDDSNGWSRPTACLPAYGSAAWCLSAEMIGPLCKLLWLLWAPRCFTRASASITCSVGLY